MIQRLYIRGYCINGYFISGFYCNDSNNARFKVGGPSQSEEVKIVELNEHYEDAELTPCQTYNYQVATMVGEQESARSELVNLRVPPR